MKKSLFWPMFRVALMFYGLLAIVVMLLVLLVCFVVGWPAKLLILLLESTLCIIGIAGVYSRFFIDDAPQEEDAAERIIVRPFRNLLIHFGLFSPRSVPQQKSSAPPPPPNRAMRRANAAQLRKKR